MSIVKKVGCFGNDVLRITTRSLLLKYELIPKSGSAISSFSLASCNSEDIKPPIVIAVSRRAVLKVLSSFKVICFSVCVDLLLLILFSLIIAILVLHKEQLSLPLTP